MSEFLEGLLKASLWGGVAACVILLLKRLAGRRLSPAFHYYVWLLLIAKLLLPAAFESPLSLFNHTAPVERVVLFEAGPTGSSSASPLPGPDGQGAALPDGAVTAGPAVDGAGPVPASLQERDALSPMEIAFYLWAAGTAVYGLALTTSYLVSRRRMRLGEPPERALTIFEECRAGRPLLRRVRLFSADAGTPFVFGFLLPFVALPRPLAREADEATLRAVFDHELTHISRLDPPLRLLTLVLQGLHWFNPLLWLAFARMRRDCELSCDAAVLGRYSESGRTAYGSALLSLAEQRSGAGASPLIAFSEGNLRQRIRHAISYRRTRVLSAVAALLLFGALAAVLLPGALSGPAVPAYASLGDGYTLSFPPEWEGEYVTTPAQELEEDTFVEVYDRANYEKHPDLDGFGWLFTLKRLPDSRFEEEWRVINRAGGGRTLAREDGCVWVVLYPTDVRYDPEDEALTGSYLSLTDGVDALLKGFVSENGLESYDLSSYEETYLLPFVNSGAALTSWEDPEELEPRLLIETYKYAAALGHAKPFTLYPRENGMDYAVPAGVVEPSIQRYFDVSAEFLRSMRYYDPALSCYVDQYNGGGPEPIPLILSARESGGVLTLRYELLWSDGSYEDAVHEVDVKLLDDGSFRYVRSLAPDGGGAPQDAANPVQAKYLDYFSQNGWQLTAMLGYEENIGLDDTTLMTFAIMGLSDYTYENGVPTQEIDGILKKYFGRTVKSYDTSMTERIPGTDRVRATGWSFDSAPYPLLLRLESNPDGTQTGIFDVYVLADSFMMDHPGLDVRGDLLSGNAGGYPTPIRIELVFTETQDADGLLLQYRSVSRVTEPSAPAQSDVEAGSAAVPWSADEALSDEEMTVAGLTLGMSYEDALALLGDFDVIDNTNPSVKSVRKNGLLLGFYLIDDSFVYQADLPRDDGVFRLLQIEAQEPVPYALPRDIKLGDSIESVLEKFPGSSSGKTLRKWAYQTVYGRDEIGVPRGELQFTLFDNCYRFFATTTRMVLNINFDHENRVRAVQLLREDG